MGFKEIEVVAMKEDVPPLGLKAGTTGTIVYLHTNGDLEVEFIDSQGGTIGLLQMDPSHVRKPRAHEFGRHLPPRDEEPFMVHLDDVEAHSIRHVG